jgi:hypothetical protein
MHLQEGGGTNMKCASSIKGTNKKNMYVHKRRRKIGKHVHA